MLKRALRLNLQGASLWGSALLLSCQGSLDAYFALGPLGREAVLDIPRAPIRVPLGDADPTGGQGGAPGPSGSTVGGGGMVTPSGPQVGVSLQPRYRLAEVLAMPAGLPAGAPSYRPADALWLVALPQQGQLWGLASAQAPLLVGGDPSAPAGLADQQGLATSSRLPLLQAAVVHPSTSLAWLADRGQARLRLLTPAGSLLPYGGLGTRPQAVGEPIASVAFKQLGDLSLDAQGGGVVAQHNPFRLVAWNPQRQVSGVVDLPATPSAIACQDAGTGAWVALGDTLWLANWVPSALDAVWQAPGPILGLAQAGGGGLYVLARHSQQGSLAGVWFLPLNASGLLPASGQPRQVAGTASAAADAPASGVADFVASDALQVPLWAPAAGGLFLDRALAGSGTQLSGDLWLYGHRGPVGAQQAELLRLKVLQ